ncbi:phage tail tape measure protein [Rhodopseudomonas parapalustris]
MSNLDVALRLRLVNQLGGPAKDAKKELEGIGAAAKKLDGAKAGKLAADLTKAKTEAKQTGAALEKAAAGTKKLDPAKADRLARGLGKSKTEALGNERALRQVVNALRQLDGTRAERLVNSLRRANTAADSLARSLRRVRSEGHGVSAGTGEGRGGPPHPKRSKAGAAVVAGGARVVGAVGGVYTAYRVVGGVKQSFEDFAELDRRMTRVGITADATKAQVDAATADVRGIAKKYAMPVEEVLKGLEVLVARGDELPDALALLDPVTQSAQASGAAVDDMAKTSGAMLDNLKIKIEELPEAFDKLSYAGKKGQFELRAIAQYLPQLASQWANVHQEGIGKLGELGAMLEIVRKQTGTDEQAANGVRDLLTKIYSTDVQNNFKKMGVDLEGGLKKGLKAGKSFSDVVIELTEQATKGDLSKLPKLFGEIDSRQAVSAIVTLKSELRALIAEINTKSAGSIVNDVARVTGDAQGAIVGLSNAWSAAGVAVGKFVAEATPAISLLEKIAGGLDSAREYFKGDKKESDAPRVDQPAGPRSAYPGRFQAAAHAKATREALAGKPPPKSAFPGRFQGAAHAAAQAQHEREVRASQTEYGAATPKRPDYSPVKSFNPPEIGRHKIKVDDPQNFSPVQPIAASVAESTMQRIRRAVASESARAVDESRSAVDAIRAIWNFSVSPQISPRLGGASGAPSSEQSAPSPAPAPAAPSGKRAALGGRSVQVVNNITVNGAGKNGRQIGSEITRELAKLGNSSNALFDTV